MRKTMLILGILSFLGIGCSDKEPKNEAPNKITKEEGQAMLLWEDNYLMVELISHSNLEFAKKETQRTSKFGEEHFDGNGFTEITEIEEISYSTDQLKIPIEEVAQLLESKGLTKYQKLMYYGGGEPTEIKDPKSIVYGKLKSGIFLEPENKILKHIWFDTYNWKEIHKTKIAEGLNAIGVEYNMILVDWNSGQIVDLKNIKEIKNYLKPND